jgi:N-acetylneuraminate synthase
MKIGSRNIGPGKPCYIVAELSANHGGSLDQAIRTVVAMKDAGADAVKVQTYTADTLTLPIRRAPFVVEGGTLWDGKTLHELYSEASMPWEWQPELQRIARDLGMDFFSTPFDDSAVEFLESLEVPVHKVASFEIVDLPLLQRLAATGKPLILSTGMASIDEIQEALNTLSDAKSGSVALLKCTSSYPAVNGDMNLRTIVDMSERFQVPIGLSDHTMGSLAPVVAVTLGACILEKHFILSRTLGGPDSSFSMEPAEFREMVTAIRTTEAALGCVSYTPSIGEEKSKSFRRSLFAACNIAKGEPLTAANVRSIRPSHGMHPRYFNSILSMSASCDIPEGTPLSPEMIAGFNP